MEKTFDEYNSAIFHSLSESGIRELSRSIESLGKFRLSPDRTWQSFRYSGFTMITPPAEAETVNVHTVTHLADAQQRLLQYLNPPRFVAAPVSAFHVTVARLISGTLFDSQLRGTREELFLKDMKRVLAQFPESGAIPLQIIGITMFTGGILVAPLSLVAEDVYLHF
jgi:hypothetical protein